MAEDEQTSSEEATRREYEAIAAHLHDGLTAVEDQIGEHRAALARIDKALSVLTPHLEEAEQRVAVLRQEQAGFPKRLNGARALVVAHSGTIHEGTAQAELNRLHAREKTLPDELAEAEGTLSTTRATAGRERERLETEREEHQQALDHLVVFAEALREEAQASRRNLGQAAYEQVKAERQAKVTALAEAEAAAAEARAELAAFDAAISDRMRQHPTHALEAALLVPVPPVHDAVTRRLEAGIAFRREVLAWWKEAGGGMWQDLPPRWFMIAQVELASPDTHMGDILHEMEKRLAAHRAEVQQRGR